MRGFAPKCARHLATPGLTFLMIRSRRISLKDALRRVTGGKGPDVIYDPVGGRFSEPALRSIAWQGRFLVIGFAAGDIPKLPLNLVLLKGCDVLGVFWGSFIERDLAGHRANTEQIMRWCLEGKVSSHIHAAYPLAQSAAALKSIADRKVAWRPDARREVSVRKRSCSRRASSSGPSRRTRAAASSMASAFPSRRRQMSAITSMFSSPRVNWWSFARSANSRTDS